MKLAGNPIAYVLLMLALALSMFAVHAETECPFSSSAWCLALRGRAVRLSELVRRVFGVIALSPLAMIVASVTAPAPLRSEGRMAVASVAPLRI